jgi:hypothetical protein
MESASLVPGPVWPPTVEPGSRCGSRLAWRGGLGWRGLGWRGLGWRGLGWRGLGWRGLGWRGLGWRGGGSATGTELGGRDQAAGGRLAGTDGGLAIRGRLAGIGAHMPARTSSPTHSTVSYSASGVLEIHGNPAGDTSARMGGRASRPADRWLPAYLADMRYAIAETSWAGPARCGPRRGRRYRGGAETLGKRQRGDPMPGNAEEPKRVFGMPGGQDRYQAPRREPQRALGFPVDWFGGVDVEFFRSFIHPIRAYRRWDRRRRLGAYALDEDVDRRR